MKKPSGSGLSSAGKIVTGIAVVVVGGAVALEHLTGSRNQPTGAVGSSAPQFQAPAMGQPGPSPQAASQVADLESRVRQNPGDHDFLLQVANFAHDNAYYDKAIGYYDQYLKFHPDDVNAIVDKGICYHELQKSEQAIEIMNQALKLQPKHLQANFNLGIINLQMRNLEKANEWFKKVVAIDPNSDIGKRAQELLAPHANLSCPITTQGGRNAKRQKAEAPQDGDAQAQEALAKDASQEEESLAVPWIDRLPCPTLSAGQCALQRKGRMRVFARVFAAVLVALVVVSARTDSWGRWGHYRITEQAIASLPDTLRQFFEAHAKELVAKSVEPDEARRWDEDEQYRHYIDIDDYGEPPFSELPGSSTRPSRSSALWA